MNKYFKPIPYILTIIISVFVLVLANNIASKDLTVFDDYEDTFTVLTIVEEITNVSEKTIKASDGVSISDVTTEFNVKILKGELKGEIVVGTQNFNSYIYDPTKQVEVGDKVILITENFDEWYFMDYYKIDKIIILGLVLVILLIIFGRMKGLNAIVSLLLTCISIFFVFIPAILNGKSIYFYCLFICAYSIISTLFIVIGINKKSFSAIFGCLGGILLTSLLTVFMSKILGLTGLINQETLSLLKLPTKDPINIKAIIFASVTIGAVGAIMDVAMSISSSLWEIREKAEDISFKSLWSSGINIGKDIMGTMMNTLVFAYIGSSLSVVVLLSVNTFSILELLNREMIIFELLQSLVGSFGIFLTMPLTALIASLLYTHESMYPDDYNSTDIEITPPK